MNLLILLATASFASVIYLGASALVRRASRASPKQRSALLTAAALLVAVAVAVIATSDRRDEVVGFCVGSIVAPIIANYVARLRRQTDRS